MQSEIDRLAERMESARMDVTYNRERLDSAKARLAEAEENWATEVALAAGFHVGQVVRTNGRGLLYRIDSFGAQRYTFRAEAEVEPYARATRLRKDGSTSLLGPRNLHLSTITPEATDD